MIRSDALKQQLKSYGALAAAGIGAISNVHADIVYEDLNPDSALVNNGDAFSINMNGGVKESFSIQLYKQPSINYFDIYGSYGVFYDYFITGGFGDWFMMENFNYNSSICSTLSNTKNGFLGWKTYGASTFTVGNFNDVTDAYIGFRFWKAGNIHNAWLRLDVDTNYSGALIKDYAYNDIPDGCIRAGQQPVYTDSCQSLSLNNLASNGNASDLQISFDTANSETGIKEYRAFILLEKDTTNVTVSALRKSNSYISFPVGSNVTDFQPDANTRDYRGNYIVGDTTYRFVVLSVPDDSLATNHVKSDFSNAVTLQKFPADVVTNIEASDISDFCNSADMEICFDKANNESGIEEYRVMVVKGDDVATFDLSAAESIVYPNYFSFPGGSNVCQVLYPYAHDVDGDTIVPGQEYVVFVLSVANQSSHFSQLSSDSSAVTLSDQCLDNISDAYFGDTRLYLHDKTLHIASDHRDMTLLVYDLSGRPVLHNAKFSGRTVHLGHLNNGVYVVTLEHNGHRMSKNVILRP